MISQFLFMDIKITEEEKCISMLCYLVYSWDSMVVAIGSNSTTLKIDNVITSLLLEEIR